MKHLGGGGAEPGVCGLVSLGDGGRRHGTGVSALAATARGWRILCRLRQGQRLVELATERGHDPEGRPPLVVVLMRDIVRIDFFELADLAHEQLSHEAQLDRRLHGCQNGCRDLVVLDVQVSSVIYAPRIEPPETILFFPALEVSAQHLTDRDALRLASQDMLALPEHLFHYTVDRRDVFVAQKVFHLPA